MTCMSNYTFHRIHTVMLRGEDVLSLRIPAHLRRPSPDCKSRSLKEECHIAESETLVIYVRLEWCRVGYLSLYV